MPQILVSTTPNPDSLKFNLDEGTIIEAGMESFNSPEEAENHPLGRRLFAIPGVANVFVVPQFLTVTKHPAAGWDQLIPEIEKVVISSISRKEG